MKKAIKTPSIFGDIPENVYRKGEKIIIKIQIPVAGAMGNALIYDKTKEWKIFLPIDKALKDLMGEDIKNYFLVHFNEKHELEIDKEIGWQPW